MKGTEGTEKDGKRIREAQKELERKKEMKREKDSTQTYAFLRLLGLSTDSGY